jgi:hypothetical protein
MKICTHHLSKIGHLQRVQGYPLWRLEVVRGNACKSKVVERSFGEIRKNAGENG